jgi:hypothetical protein
MISRSPPQSFVTPYSWLRVGRLGLMCPQHMSLLRVGLDDDRMIALDAATVLSPKLIRYFAVIALLTLGEDKALADAVRELTPKVTAVSGGVAKGRRRFAQLESDLQKAIEDFRSFADKRLGNAK